jgi:hypothetical protein
MNHVSIYREKKIMNFGIKIKKLICNKIIEFKDKIILKSGQPITG